MKHEIQSVKQSITFMKDEVDTLKEKAETNIKEMKGGLEERNKKIVAVEVQLNAEFEKTSSSNSTLAEKTYVSIHSVIQNDMGIDTSEIKFHTVHRVGKKMESRCRPIICLFISRKDRNLILAT